METKISKASCRLRLIKTALQGETLLQYIRWRGIDKNTSYQLQTTFTSTHTHTHTLSHTCARIYTHEHTLQDHNHIRN